MKLLELLVQETKKGNFEWSQGCNYVAQDNYGSAFKGDIYAYKDTPVKFDSYWSTRDGSGFGKLIIKSAEVADDCAASVITREQYEAALAAAQPQWDGEDLPPVGCECEAKQFAQTNWNKFKVVAVEDGHVFGFWDNKVGSVLSSKMWEFRPIGSERDEAVLQMLIDVKEITTEQAEALYDAGYRK